MIRRATHMVRLGSSLVVAIVAAAIVYWLWLEQDVARMPPGVLSGRGVLAADEVPVATPVAGRLVDLLVKEGDVVTPGVVVARIAATSGGLRVITSTKGGRVRGLTATAGAVLDAGAMLFALVDLAELHIVVPFQGRAAMRLRVGGEARIVFADVSGRAVAGRVTALTEPDGGMAPDSGEPREVTATVDVTDARSLTLKPGLRADVYVRTEEGASWPVFIR